MRRADAMQYLIGMMTINSIRGTAAWRVRLSWGLDILAGGATFLAVGAVGALQQALLGYFDLWRSVLWHDLFLFIPTVGLFGTLLAAHVLLARRGQTLGLALLRLRWRTPAGRPAPRRLLGEPQCWLAAGPALYLTLLSALALLLLPTPVGNDDAPWLTYGLGVAVVAAAIVAVPLARRLPGRLAAETGVV